MGEGRDCKTCCHHIADCRCANTPLQHQGSLTDQLAELIPVADRMGLYDAADYLRVILQKGM